jgi:hypothetical protein
VAGKSEKSLSVAGPMVVTTIQKLGCDSKEHGTEPGENVAIIHWFIKIAGH